MCSKALYSDDRLLFDIEISGKTQKYCLESVCNFKVTRFYLILHSPAIFLSTYKLVPRGCDPFGQHQGSFRSSRIAKALGTRLCPCGCTLLSYPNPPSVGSVYIA